MAATKNEASAKGDSVNLMHPFKLDVVSTEKTDANDRPIYKVALNWHSKLYSGFKNPQNGGKQFLTFQKLKISNLDYLFEVPSDIYTDKYYYCLLDVIVQELKATSAKIKFVKGSSSDELHPVAFQSGDDLRQIAARVLLGVVVFDDKYTPSNAQRKISESGESATVDSLYVLQYVHSNLLMTNMVLNGVPVVYPVPFPGSTTSVDGSDQLE